MRKISLHPPRRWCTHQLIATEDLGDFRRAEVFRVVLRGADFTGALLLRLVLQVGVLEDFSESDAPEGWLLLRQFGERRHQFLLRREQCVGGIGCSPRVNGAGSR